MLYLNKTISTFYHDYLKKATIIFLLINLALLMARPIVKPGTEASNTKFSNIKASNTQQKQDKFAKDNITSKYTKKHSTSDFYLVFNLILITSKRFFSHKAII